MSRGKKHPVALIVGGGLLALGLTLGGVSGLVGLTARAHASPQPAQYPNPTPEPVPSPPAFDAGPLPAPYDAAPYDAGLSPYDAGR
jgi:hypothetical protein